MRKYEKWTPEEDKIIAELYSSTSNNEIALRLKRTPNGVRGRARKLLLTKKRQTYCEYCGKRFEAKRHDYRFCSKKCQHKSYVENHKSHYRELRKRENQELKARLHALWGLGSVGSGQTAFSRRVEQYVADVVLPKEGFSDILLTRPIASMFPYFDILARKNNEICGIQVTTLPMRKIPSKVKPLVDFLNMRVFVCHVKPDFTWYCIQELKIREGTKRTSSSCVGAFMKWYSLTPEAKQLIHEC
jgi:hypothetical protein